MANNAIGCLIFVGGNELMYLIEFGAEIIKIVKILNKVYREHIITCEVNFQCPRTYLVAINYRISNIAAYNKLR